MLLSSLVDLNNCKCPPLLSLTEHIVYALPTSLTATTTSCLVLSHCLLTFTLYIKPSNIQQ